MLTPSQTRIAKAVKQGKWYLVKRLRYLLINSHYAKLLASIACNTESRGDNSWN
ncbi:MAG: reverse transcriptase N-terminal domain-containing protein [Euryarchaeota archaeon]|nr:reverse transcriptase N-terminal domain-containing protein [Euryarchaeota archaeon]